MPINNADIPIADNEPEIKIDNPVERAYLYRIISSANPTIFPVGLKFYKYKQKFQRKDTFISEDGASFIWARRIGGNAGWWTMSYKLGLTNASTVTKNFNSNFFITNEPVEGTYNNGVILSKITTDTR
jgi:asparagine N-glycosylation enzyme membrane subunit Stt3